MILQKIIDEKKKDLVRFKKENNLEELKNIAKNIGNRPSFKDALERKGLSIIGELKKASPSKGIIREEFELEKLMKYYEDSVDACSILTEEKFFLGKGRYLEEASKISSLPLLRKDFIIDEIQIYEAKILGASGILLICAILTVEKLRRFMKIAKSLNLDCLVETHNKEEVLMALEVEAEIIGINNRNLNNFYVTIETTLNLLELIPQGKIVVSESGFNTMDDVEKIRGHRVDAILVGESFMRADNIKKKVKSFKEAFEIINYE